MCRIEQLKNLNLEQGKRLKECLDDKSMRQKELAKKSGYTEQYISYIVNGKKKLSWTSSEIFAGILGVRKEYLLCKDNFKTIKHKRDFMLDNLGELCDLSLLILEKFGGISVINAKTKEGETFELRNNTTNLLDAQAIEARHDESVIELNPKFIEIGLELGGIKKDIPKDMLYNLLSEILDFIDFKCERFKKEFDKI